MSIFGKLTEKYPQLPTLLANTAASKVIQLVKKRVLDPVFAHERTIQSVQAWPRSVQKMAEWAMYLLSGTVRTMPDRVNPIAIVLQEALAESLTQVGMKIEDINAIPMVERIEIIDVTMPRVRPLLIGSAADDYQFQRGLNTIFGTIDDWVKFLDEAVNSVSRVREKTQAHREARKARGWRRFLWWK